MLHGQRDYSSACTSAVAAAGAVGAAASAVSAAAGGGGASHTDTLQAKHGQTSLTKNETIHKKRTNIAIFQTVRFKSGDIAELR